jgi:transposase InsO family protein
MAQAESLTRELNGCIGAVALSKAVAGISRRAAARIVKEVRTRLEAERKARAGRVYVSSPGVMRGFDAMDLGRGKGHVLVASDAAVPYRTTLEYVGRYDADTVAETLDKDFTENGAPLVLRLDQARQHKTASVDAVLNRHGVLALHGPAHHPQYYGQLERQNREHRAWLSAANTGALELDRMRKGLNELLPRRGLNWATAAARWDQRGSISIDRNAFIKEVHEAAERIRDTQRQDSEIDVRRLAIHQTLVNHGLLKLAARGKC